MNWLKDCSCQASGVGINIPGRFIFLFAVVVFDLSSPFASKEILTCPPFFIICSPLLFSSRPAFLFISLPLKCVFCILFE